jgi:predicted peptidase
MTAVKLLALAVGIFGWLEMARAASAKTHGFLDRVHTGPGGKKARYGLFVPHLYKADKTYPLILFLHGHGESGTDGRRPVEVGLGPAIRQRERTFPFLALFPQSQKFSWQATSDDSRRALAILAEVMNQYQVDPQRVYLTGLSMGGFGTWSLAARYPKRWAALVPVCGGGNPQHAAKIKDIPCWCFHGAADTVVPVTRSREMIQALQAEGGAPRYTEYPGVGHDSWTNAYGTAELYEWLLQQALR